MSTSKTTNYLLHSWAGTDYVKRLEFNENFTTIDTTLKTLDTNIAGKAATSHVHTAGTQTVAGFISTADKIKLDGIAVSANNYVHPSTHLPSVIVQDASNRFVTDTEKAAWNAKAPTAIVTTTVNGLMIAADKVKLDGIAASANNYVHPANHPASIITQDVSNRFVTDTEKSNWNAKATTAVATTIADGLLAAADKVKLNGIATGAQINQNAFSNVLANGVTVAADNATDTFEIAAGTNVVVTGDATNDKITISLGPNSETTAGAQAKADAVKTWANTYGVGGFTSNLSGPDLDNILNSGTYYISGGINIPVAGDGYGFLEVIAVNANYAYQIYHSVNFAERFYKRVNIGAVWSAWIQMETSMGAQVKASAAETNAKNASTPIGHVGTGSTAHAAVTTAVNGFMIASDKSKLDGIAAGANNYAHPATHPPSIIVQDASNRFMTDAERTKLSGIATGATNYVHPAAHPPSIITQDVSNRFTTDAEKAAWNAKETPAGAKLQIEQDSVKTTKITKDANGIYTTVEHRRKSDNLLVRRSVLSGGTSPLYTTRTVTFYAANGTTVAKTDIFTITYDADGDLLSEV